VTEGVHNGSLTRAIAIGSARHRGGVGSGPSPAARILPGDREGLVRPWPLAFWASLVIAALAVVFFHRDRLVALVLTGSSAWSSRSALRLSRRPTLR
jgi:multicomponent K+:H+ antiporter subunit A